MGEAGNSVRPKRRLPQVDALRGLASMMVLIYHYADVSFGQRGATLFFVISGFVILASLESKASLHEFAWARFARLYPVFWASLVYACLCIVITGHASELTFGRVLANLTMAPFLFQKFAASGGPDAWQRFANIDLSYWTLVYELFFYMLAGCCVLVLRVSRIELACLAWLALAAVERVTHPIPPPWDVFAAVTMHFAECFVAGIVVYLFYQRRGSRLTLLTGVGALALSLVGLHGDFLPKYPLVIGASSVLVWLGARGALRVLDFAPLLFLGRVSYAL